jgi:hypothetical protein
LSTSTKLCAALSSATTTPRVLGCAGGVVVVVVVVVLVDELLSVLGVLAEAALAVGALELAGNGELGPGDGKLEPEVSTVDDPVSARAELSGGVAGAGCGVGPPVTSAMICRLAATAEPPPATGPIAIPTSTPTPSMPAANSAVERLSGNLM